MLTVRDCEDIERENGSPFYVLDRDAFVDAFSRFDRAFRSRYERIKVGYSYKTSYIPYLCRLVSELGGHAEVVSSLEYDLALRVGQDPSRIIFNGPLKRDGEIALALRNGSLVNLDCARELQHVATFAQRNRGAPVRIGLRVNLDVADPEGSSNVQEAKPVSRFGFPPEALGAAGAALASCGVRVSALHGHASTTTRSTRVFERITRTLCRLAEELFPDTVEEIDVGGGFFGKMPQGLGPPGTPAFDDYAEVIVGTLQQSAWARGRRPWLVLEPGVALAAASLSFVTRILDVKEIRGRVLAISDGTIFNVKPSMHAKNLPFQVIRDGASPRSGERRLSVAGATCMEKDYLLTDVVSAVDRGDFLQIDHVGAYTVVMTPPFIHPAPAIVVRERGAFLPVRTRETFDHVFRNYAL